MEAFTDRFLEVLDDLVATGKAKSVREIALKIDLKPAQISESRKPIETRRNIPIKYIDALEREYNVNKLYLTTGKGEKYLEDKMNIKKTIDFTSDANMFWVPLKAYGGFLLGYENTVYLNSLKKSSFPLVKGPCFAFEIEGFSMIDMYYPGDHFVGSEVESFHHLTKGRDYVFQTIDGLILKRYENIEGDFIYLSSINEEYNPVKPIFLKDIKKVYHKEYLIKSN